MNRAQSLLASIALALVVIGCNSVKAPIEGRHDPYPAGQIHFASGVLRDNTAVGTPVASRDDTGNILYITIPIRSTSSAPMYVDYRVTFFDRNGQQLNQTGWFTRLLNPNIPDSISVNSMGPRAADFQVDFRDAR